MAEANAAGAAIQSVDCVREAKLTVQADKDKQYFFDDNPGTLALQFKFAFLPYNDEEVGKLCKSNQNCSFRLWLFKGCVL